VFGQVNSFFYL